MTLTPADELCLTAPAWFDGLSSDTATHWERMVDACLAVRSATTRPDRGRAGRRAATITLRSIRTVGGLSEWDASLLVAQLAHIAGQELPLSAEQVGAVHPGN